MDFPYLSFQCHFSTSPSPPLVHMEMVVVHILVKAKRYLIFQTVSGKFSRIVSWNVSSLISSFKLIDEMSDEFTFGLHNACWWHENSRREAPFRVAGDHASALHPLCCMGWNWLIYFKYADSCSNAQFCISTNIFPLSWPYSIQHRTWSFSVGVDLQSSNVPK